MFSEWLYLPEMVSTFLGDPLVWLFLIAGVVLGYVIGVIPGLGPTMGMALCLSVIFRLEYTQGMALLVGIFVAACGSGGITASLINIPGTPAAAATCLDGYALTKQGRGREAAGYSVMASVVGTLGGTILIFLIQPFVTTIALKFGDWETFLFCLFGILICGSIAGGSKKKGWIAAFVGCFLSLVGVDSVQSVQRFTFGNAELLGGFDSTIAMLGLFGIGEVIYSLREPEPMRTVANTGFPIINVKVLKKNIGNIIRSVFAGLWIGFIPGIGESAACWFSYDMAKRAAKGEEKEKFGNGAEAGIIAAEVADNSCSAGALIPAMALGIPGSSTAAIFLSAMYIMNLRPGPTLLIETPGFLCGLCLLLAVAAILMGIISFVLARATIKILSIPERFLMPLVAVLCAVGAYNSTGTPFALIQLAFFGFLGYIMKLRHYPIAPFVLGLLIGPTADTSLRRALMQYSDNLFAMVGRPFGLGLTVVLVIFFILGLKSDRSEGREED